MLSKKSSFEWCVLLFVIQSLKFNVFVMCFVEDASDITWAHAVNSRDALEKAMSSPVHFLEADVTLGHIIGDKDTLPIPVMAHPPNTSSDLSLNTWLDLVFTQSPGKGLKIDFKSIGVVEPALLVLQKHALQFNSSLWLNADILPGPINSLVNPIDALQFLTKCQQYFPKATLSIGWTTLFTNGTLPDFWHYEWKHVRRMVDVIRCSGHESNYPTITFPVRAIFASRSLKLFQWLLDAIPGSSLTVWSSKNDPLELTDLVRIRSSFPKQSVFYDIPGQLHELFQDKKHSINTPSYETTRAGDQWIILTSGHDDDCSSLTYINNETIVFGRSLTTAVLQKSLLVVENDSNLKIAGCVTFFENKDELASYTGKQEVVLLLVDVSLFSKSMSHPRDKDLDITTIDSEVLWSAINSSVIFTFQHAYENKGPPCHAFKLDITANFFEVSAIPCTSDEKSFGEIVKRDKPDVLRTKRILPDGPFLFGLMSRGKEHAVVHDLSISGQKPSALISGSLTTCTLLSTFLPFCSILCSWLPFCL